eukprot:PhF_6_TR33833/c1_g1_i1/m.49617
MSLFSDDVESFELPSVTTVHTSCTVQCGLNKSYVFVATTESLHVLSPGNTGQCNIACLLRVASSPETIAAQCIGVMAHRSKPRKGGFTVCAGFVPKTVGIASTLSAMYLDHVVSNTKAPQNTSPEVWDTGSFEVPFTPIVIRCTRNDLVLVSGTDCAIHAYTVTENGFIRPTSLPSILECVNQSLASPVMILEELVSGGTTAQGWVLGCMDGRVIYTSGDRMESLMFRGLITSVWELLRENLLIVAEGAGHVHVVNMADKSLLSLESTCEDHLRSGVSSVALCPWKFSESVDIIVGTLSGHVLRFDGTNGKYSNAEVVDVGGPIMGITCVDANNDGLYEVIVTCQRSVVVLYFSSEKIVRLIEATRKK